jgi:hypothetical protein
MIQEAIIHGTTSPVSREDIADWLVRALETLPLQIVKNSWRHGVYSWFPDETNNNENE